MKPLALWTKLFMGVDLL